MHDNLHTDSSFFRVHHMVHRVYHPKVLGNDCLFGLRYISHLWYSQPKEKILLRFVLASLGERGRIFIACDEFKVWEMEESIAKDKGVENAVIDYYRQISKEEYKIQKDKHEQD